MKKQSGITLISLVVTIIILIILAGISINLILGQDGIINKAKEAKQNMEYAQIEEQEQLNELYGQMSGESSGSISYDAIAKLTEFKKALADYIEGKNVDRPETAGDASVYINSFEKVLLAEQNKHSEFKSKVAEAITEMGIETTEDADANTMANNIKNISKNSYWYIKDLYTTAMSNGYSWTHYVIDTSSAQTLSFTQTSTNTGCGTFIFNGDTVLVNDDHCLTNKKYTFDCSQYDELTIIAVSKNSNNAVRIIDISLD